MTFRVPVAPNWAAAVMIALVFSMLFLACCMSYYPVPFPALGLLAVLARFYAFIVAFAELDTTLGGGG